MEPINPGTQPKKCFQHRAGIMSKPNSPPCHLLASLRDNDLDRFSADFSRATLPDGQDYDLLAEALRSERKDIAHYLLYSGCATSKPNCVNILVHVALENDWHDVVERLLELELPVSTRNGCGDTAVHVAFKRGYPGAVIDCLLGCYLLETTENVVNKEGLSVLHVACSRPDVEVFKKIVFKSESEESVVYRVSYDDLNSQVRLGSKSPYAGYTALHFAIANGCTEVIKLLLHGCHINICKQDASNSTPLHLALQRRDIETIDILLANNSVYQDYVNKAGLTHVMAACAGTTTEIAINFLNYTNMHAMDQLKSVVNARVEDPDNSLAGYTPLHFAAEYGRFQTVQMLYLFEACIFAKTAQDLTALVLAVKKNHQCIARLIFNYYKTYRQSICDDGREPVVLGEVPMMKKLANFE